jgi:uncharacterized membrane protein YdjX (TVP38/TMEM64 family)
VTETLETPQKPRGAARLILFVAIALAAIVACAFTPIGDYLSKESISRLAESLGWGGPVVVILAGIVTPMLFLPRWPIAFISGLLYGIVWGTLLSNVASTLGAYVNFVLAKTLLGPATDRLRDKYDIARLEIPRDKAFVVLFLIRAFPLSNFVATNLLAGALRIHLWTYMTSTFLGMLPSSLMYASWGKLLKKPSGEFYWVAAFTVLMVVGGAIVAQRYLHPWLKSMKGPGAGSVAATAPGAAPPGDAEAKPAREPPAETPSV